MPKYLTALAMVCLPLAASGLTWVVPDDAPTIQGGIDLAAAGDTVIVACGTYHESALDLTVPIILRSEADDPDCVVIDGGDADTILYCEWDEGIATVVGITFTSGHGVLCGGARVTGAAAVEFDRCVFADNAGGGQPGGGRGGAVGCFDQSRLTLRNCRLERNGAYGGGGVYGEGDAVVNLDACLLVANVAAWGAGVELRDASIGTIESCTFFANESFAWYGAGITNWTDDPVQVTGTIIAFSVTGSAIDGSAELTNCDLYGNPHGDWVGAIAEQLAHPCNMAADPVFCDVENGDFSLDFDSHCLAFNNICGVQIGAFGLGCPLTGAPPERTPSLVVTGCYPNPFNPRLTVSFTLASDAELAVSVLDVAGREVARLVDERRGGGTHDVVWDGRDVAGRELPSGVYVVRLQTELGVATEKVMLMR